MSAKLSSSVVLLLFLLIIITTSFSSTNFFLVTAQQSSAFPTHASLWNCPPSCGAAATSWCSDIFAQGGKLEAVNCISDSTGQVLSFECICNSRSSGIQIVEYVNASSTTASTTTTTTTSSSSSTTTSSTTTGTTSSSTTSNPTTTTTTTPTTTFLSSTTASADNETSTSATTVEETTSSTSTAEPPENSTSTTTTTTTTTNGAAGTSTGTSSTTSLPPIKKCQINPSTKPYFQRSPLGMFCRALSGACPWTCDSAVVRAFAEECSPTAASTSISTTTTTSSSPSSGNGGETTTTTTMMMSTSSSTTTEATTPSPPSSSSKQELIMSCVSSSTFVRAQCTSCNSGIYTVQADLSLNGTVSSCSHQVTYFNPSSPLEITAPNSCGTDQCSSNGCCSQDHCSCFSSVWRGYYQGPTCSACESKYTLDLSKSPSYCTLQIPNILQLLNLLGRRPSAIVAPVLCITAAFLLLASLRGRWATDVERYVVPAGISLTDPVSGFAVNPKTRFFVPPRPVASRGIVNQLKRQKML